MRVLLTGASGLLGPYLLRELSAAATVTAWSGSRTGSLLGFDLHPVHLTDTDHVARAFREARPAVVIHAGAVSSVADCFRDPALADRVNVGGTALLAELAGEHQARLVMVSTDLVFDGERGRYREEDETAPLSVYGRTKVVAEQAALRAPRGVVVRVSLLFGPSLTERRSFFDEQVSALRQGRPCRLFEDEWRTPLGLSAAARGLLAVARSDFEGVLHLGGPERLSRVEMGRRLAEYLGCDPSVIQATMRAQAGSPEPRPRDVSLDSSRWRQLFPGVNWPDWDEAVREMMPARESPWTA